MYTSFYDWVFLIIGIIWFIEAFFSLYYSFYRFRACFICWTLLQVALELLPRILSGRFCIACCCTFSYNWFAPLVQIQIKTCFSLRLIKTFMINWYNLWLFWTIMITMSTWVLWLSFVNILFWLLQTNWNYLCRWYWPH